MYKPRLQKLRDFVNSKAHRGSDRPIRDQLFPPEDLIEQASVLAIAHQNKIQTPPDLLLLQEFQKNARFLHNAYLSINHAVTESEPIPPAEEWFLDNFHVITDQLRAIREDLPKKFYLELPALVTGTLQGYPRTYEMALQLIAHTDSQLSVALLKRYMGSYQSASVLTTGELWALPTLLRAALIENLKRIILVSNRERNARLDANRFAERLIAASSTDEIERILNERKQDPRRIGGAFAVQLILRLRDEPPAHFSAVVWLYDRLTTAGIDADELIRRKHHDLAAAQVSVSNIIQSLRLLGTMDWAEVVEEVSLVHAGLREDPAHSYSQCDFATRDQYRHAIEDISRKSAKSETEVTALVLQLANEASLKDSSDIRQSHVGYYLISKGRKQLEQLAGFRSGLKLSLRQTVARFPGFFYQFPIVSLTAILVSLIASFASARTENSWLVVLIAAVCFIPASALAVLIVNWMATWLMRPKILPKLELKEGIPPEHKSMVVIPTMLLNPSEVRKLVSKLEVLYLANNEDNLDFALLTDYADSETESLPSDENLLAEARGGLAALNAKYPRTEGPRFHIYHRRRIWNHAEEKWMGWERKRGKLEEFNQLLLGHKDTTYHVPSELPGGIQYVITLDTDTILPRDSARKLIGTISHPLNRPVLNSKRDQVTDGYAILQPRVSHSLTSANRTAFSRIFSGYVGIDPYTTAVSDIYQDLFQEGSFIGKGIYDFKAFQMSVENRFPENTLLSHDLIEGAYARTALVTDVELFDDHPSDYTSFILRLHRWVRGDWQVAPWLFARVPDARNEKVSNTLSWLNRWKLLDNLRRSLVAPTLFLTVLLGWLVFPGSALFWNVVLVSIVFAPLLVQFVSGIQSMSSNVRWVGRLWGLGYDAAFNALQSILQLSLLPMEAWIMSDAIIRTLWRMTMRRRLLEWTTAAQGELVRGNDLLTYAKRFYGSLALTVASLILIVFIRPHSLPAALPILLLWILAPFFAYLTGQRALRRERKIPKTAVSVLRSYAREIWRFFETFVSTTTNWLPADNMQEIPEETVAPRTSPTNIGFLFLSNIAAYDFGYIGAMEFVERTQKTLETLTKLKTFNGHFFNWYDTQTLAPLEPRYVSTVDSGNLVAALIVLKQFALELAMNVAESFEPRTGHFSGVRDTFQKFLSANGNEHNQPQFAELEKLLNIDPVNAAHQEELLQSLNTAMGSIEFSDTEDGEAEFWWNASKHVLATHLFDHARPQDIPGGLLAISREAEAFVHKIDFRFLFNETRGIFSIGFNVTNGQPDRSSYDLFASEARLASFVAIAKGDVPQSHWFRMARAMTTFGRRRILASWSGSMFEYLMPLLFLRNEPHTLFDVTYRGAVDLQRIYGREQGAPWGASEAAYNTRDISQNYQYGPFGVPALGLKRGLSRDLVIAPYATFLALMVHPISAIRNLEHLRKMGMHGRFGFYESIDFTKDRLRKGEKFSVVQTFMAHHQGMSLVALDNAINRNEIQKRFHADPAVEATALLLQEKMPLAVRSEPVRILDERPEVLRPAEPAVAQEFRDPLLTPPRTQILSNGNYLVMLTTAGGSYSEWRGLRLTRWSEDVTRDHRGSFLYIKDLRSGKFWSAGFQPTLKHPDYYHVVYGEDKVEFHRRDGSVESHLDIVVSPEDPAELRRLILINTSGEKKEIEVTSYLEVVLNTAAADLAHRAFSNLFVETEYVPEVGALVASRRPRSSEESVYWSAHVLASEDNLKIEYETDRRRFLGRNRSTVFPQALDPSFHLSDTAGAVLDPIFSLRVKVELEPYSRKTLTFCTLAADSREQVLALAEKYRTDRGVHRAFELASVQAQVMLRQLSIKTEEAHLFQRIAGRFIYSDLSLRPSPTLLARNTLTQAALWRYGISGDLPICLMRVEDESEMEIVRQILRAHDYWRTKGFVVDLVILNEFPSSYFQELQEVLLSAIRNSPTHTLVDKPGGIFLRQADQMSEEDRTLLRTVARVQVVAQRGSLARQVARTESKDPLPMRHIPLSQFPIIDPPVQIPVPELIFDNGFGGFTRDGKEYVISLKDGTRTPAPWINVIANPQFGFQISESGAGMTWCINSQENRLTPWSNDASSDPIDSATYIRDEENGIFWSPTPQPAPGTGDYVVAHGAGYSRFQHGGYGIEQELLLFAPTDAPVKILHLRLRNRTSRRRWLSVTHYAELVLGADRSHSAPFVITSIDSKTGGLFARNPYNNEFANRVAFLWVNDKKRTVTADRTVFLGPIGEPKKPAAMSYAHLSGGVGAGLDPCAAVQAKIELDPLSEQTVIFLFGQARDVSKARELIERFSTLEQVQHAYEQSCAVWEKRLNSIQVKTPDPQMDLLLNRWLLYQTYSCRFFSRSAFYQSGGAYGFRDQLQDALAFIYSDPELLREQLLRAAAHQFVEGDVQHWWHPPTGRGVRTRSSDDLLWLPYCAAHYLRTTGDAELLHEQVSFLEAPLLGPEEMENYHQPEVSKESGSLYEHCIRAIEYSLRFGAHGLALIGSGDWNDGMNRLGIHGRGESVWLSWFLLSILKRFVHIAESCYDQERANRFREIASRLTNALEEHGWDGEWYRRGFDDDGVAFGSQQDSECRIDSIAQSWAALSHSADPSRVKKAMESVERLLLNSSEQIALLFTPPFEHTTRDPGYIKGYPPGIRENGGHYTHAATWLIAGYAELGHPENALDLFHMCSPITHSFDRAAAEKYKLEPYVCAADIYSHPFHMGLGGWSWYTGSAAWLYRGALEWILGFRLFGDYFTLEPCIPASWPGFEITYRRDGSSYHIQVVNSSGSKGGIKSIELDDKRLKHLSVPLTGQEGDHSVRVFM